MKRQPTKLVVRRETLRSLAGLELVRVVGGDAAMWDTDKEVCTSRITPQATPPS
jgi:hypothetical protein